MEFHIDTGAEVTVISEHASSQIGCPPLTPQHTLQDPDTLVLPIKGLSTEERRACGRRGSLYSEGATQATPRSTSYRTG